MNINSLNYSWFKQYLLDLHYLLLFTGSGELCMEHPCFEGTGVPHATSQIGLSTVHETGNTLRIF